MCAESSLLWERLHLLRLTAHAALSLRSRWSKLDATTVSYILKPLVLPLHTLNLSSGPSTSTPPRLYDHAIVKTLRCDWSDLCPAGEVLPLLRILSGWFVFRGENLESQLEPGSPPSRSWSAPVPENSGERFCSSLHLGATAVQAPLCDCQQSSAPFLPPPFRSYHHCIGRDVDPSCTDTVPGPGPPQLHAHCTVASLLDGGVCSLEAVDCAKPEPMGADVFSLSFHSAEGSHGRRMQSF